ncbi:unnamed protein product [Lepeophtheirus salmonis]|uniref:(salmon louse) hypothetical protein n=1 Tax=Lepeophtheirus salmonis TaxID=72036 RepID=A0A7R8HBV4_LEPSM|nr:unnamed protein product [Lepeophtheirus salmonis]CAF2994663.1 unnamed protein product [Lepeophtheirus salmonis]
MSPFNLIFTLISLYFIASSNVKGLKCYTCNHDTNNPNPKCITHPETQTSSVCNNPEHDHCYTRKIVKINGDEMYFTRACCKIGEANVCPRGSAREMLTPGQINVNYDKNLPLPMPAGRIFGIKAASTCSTYFTLKIKII